MCGSTTGCTGDGILWNRAFVKGEGLRPSCSTFLRGGYERGLHAFQGRQRNHERFAPPEETKGGGRPREVTAAAPVLTTSPWGMFDADDARVVSQSPYQLRKVMGMFVVVYTAFDLAVSKAKTDIMCFRIKRVSKSTAIFSVEAAGQVYNQTNEFLYLKGNVNHNADLLIEVDRQKQRTVQLPELHPRTVRPTECSPRVQTTDANSRDTRGNTVRLRHVEPARVPLRHHQLAEEQSRRSPDFLSGHANQDGKWEHRGDYEKEADLFRGICGTHGGYATAEVRDIRRTCGGTGFVGG